jgi:hypothetical protein
MIFDIANIRFPKKLAEQIRARAKAANISVSAFFAHLLREDDKDLRRRTKRKKKKLSVEEIKQRMDLPHAREDTLDPALHAQPLCLWRARH